MSFDILTQFSDDKDATPCGNIIARYVVCLYDDSSATGLDSTSPPGLSEK